jgi:hypothetical protein
MPDARAFRALSSASLADVLDRGQVMDIGSLAGDSLMLRAAIRHAAPGSVTVVRPPAILRHPG